MPSNVLPTTPHDHMLLSHAGGHCEADESCVCRMQQVKGPWSDIPSIKQASQAVSLPQHSHMSISLAAQHAYLVILVTHMT